MIIFLIFLFFILLIELILIGIIFSRIAIKIDSIEITKFDDTIHFDEWNVSLKVYLYKILPVVKIKVYREYCSVLGRKFYYNDKIKYNSDNQFYKSIYKFLKEDRFENFDLNFEELDLYLNFGTENMIITTGLTVLISNFLTLLIRKKIKRFDESKCKFKVEPNFINRNNFRLKVKSKLNLKTLNLINYSKEIFNSTV